MGKTGSKETLSAEPRRAVVITVSDSCAAGRRDDLSGPRCRDLLIEMGLACDEIRIVPDDRRQLVRILTELSDRTDVDLLLTTGGTGLSPRDVTPEATLDIAERVVPGIGEVLRAEGYRRTPHAVLSRATAVIRHGTLIINLPGSVRGVTEGLEVLAPILGHALEVTAGDVGRCGG